MVRKRLFLISILLFFISLHSNAVSQPARVEFETITLKDGLSQNTINSIAQDSYGFMWFGTCFGLNRYDGYEFNNLFTNIHDSLSIRDNWITSLYYKEPFLWIGTKNSGLHRLNTYTGRMKFYSSIPDSSGSLTSNLISNVYEDSSGRLWVSTLGGGLDLLLPESDSFIHLKPVIKKKNNLENNRLYFLIKKSDEAIFIITVDGLIYTYSEEDKALKIYNNEYSNENFPAGYLITAAVLWKERYLILGTAENGIKIFDIDENTYINENEFLPAIGQVKGFQISSLFNEDESILWIGTAENGLYKYDRPAQYLSHFKAGIQSRSNLPDNNIQAIFKDRSGSLWFGTSIGGISKYSPKKTKFNKYSNVSSDNKNLSINNIWSFLEDRNGNFWIGTDGDGTIRFSSKLHKYSYYKHEEANKNSLSDNSIWDIKEDREGDILIATQNGLNVYNTDTKKFKRYFHDDQNKTSISLNKIHAIIEDSYGEIWIGTWGRGIDLFSRETQEFRNFSIQLPGRDSLTANKIACIIEDSERKMWIGTDGAGVVLFDPVARKFSPINNEILHTDDLNHTTVSFLYEDSIGDIWICTLTGLYCLRKKENKLVYFGERYNFPLNMIYGILEDDRGNYWISSNQGLFKYNRKNETTRAYTIRDGLQSNEFNSGACYKNSKGKLFFGGINGFNSFYSDIIKVNEYIPPIVITSISSNENILKFDSPVYSLKEIRLSYHLNFFTFEFSALDYTDPISNQYAYKLEGIDDNWILCGNRRYANYTNIGPGEYLFKVKGTNNDFIWNENPRELKVIIVPPFWMTGWFKLIFLIVIVISVIFLFKYRVKSVEKQKSKLEQQVSERTRELSIARDNLEKRVQERTKELSKANISLQKEINERINIEAALRESEEKYRTLIENSNDAIYLLYDNKFEIINDKFGCMFGYTLEEVNEPDFHFFQLVAPGSRDIINQRIEKVKKGEPVSPSYEFQSIAKDGTLIDVDVSVTYIKYKNGIATQGILRNITEKKRAEEEKKKLEEQLFQAQKMESIGRLAGGIAHDFNNILTTIIGYAEYLVDNENDNSPQKNAAEIILSSSEKAAYLTRQLLGFARGGKYYPVPLNLNNVIKEIIYVSEKIFEKQIAINYELHKDIWNIEADKNQIDQVLTNLIINAKDAMPHGGEITIKTENMEISDIKSDENFDIFPGRYIRMTISDTGIGMSEEVKKHIFEPFFSTKTLDKGTGLGLATVYGIIKNHYGFIDVNSSPGKGTSFSVYFPVTDKEIADKAKTEETVTGKANILIVDDEMHIRNLAKRQLESLGYKVYIAEDGINALEIYKQHQDTIDLILLDIIMPNMNGKETFKKLKEINENVKVLLMSGFSENMKTDNLNGDGIAGFVQKPFRIKQLSEIFQKTLEKYKK